MTHYDPAELARALFEELGDALFLLDPDTDQLLDVNPVGLRMTGFARAEILEFPAASLFRFESAGGSQRLRGAFAKTTVFHSQDGFLLRTRDDWVPVNLTVSRLHVSPRPLGLIIARDDRERRQALAQARRVEAELRQVLASSPAALWSAERAPGPDVTTGWQFRYVSPLLSAIAGRRPDFFDHPFKWADAVHPSDREPYRAALHRLLTGAGTQTEAVYRVVAPDGAVRWVRDRVQVVRDQSARPVRIDGCVVDITEHRQAEEALRQNEQRFRALVEKSRDGIVLLDEQGAVRYATAAVRSVLGYEPASVAGRDVFAFVHPDDAAAAREVFADILRRPGEDVPATFRARAADGSVRVIESNGCNRLSDPSVRAVVLNYRDVTERANAARALASQHAILEGLFASVPDVVCYTDRNLRYLGGNPAFEELAGRPLSAVVGRTCEEVFPTQAWAARLRAAEPGVLETGKTFRGKEWVRYPGGREALLDLAVSPLRGGDGRPAGLILTGRDVTEQNRLEEQLRQSQKMEAVGRLAGGIAHDFNNLLTVILGNLELVRTGAAGDETDELLESTERAARQAADLTKQMLGFARRQPLRTATLDLNAVVNDAVGLLRRTIKAGIAIRVEPAADLHPVAADPVQVQQVLMNLCLNARDAMPDGGTLTVTTANVGFARRPGAGDDEPEAPFVRVSVADTGVGMTDDVRAKIFEPFFTTKDVGQGTGLGLAVVYGVARAHGGWVECHSSPGAGSRFDVYLPRAVTSADRADVASRTPPPATGRGRGEVVLVADDEPLVLDVARTALERSGYRVLTARDGLGVVEVFRRERAAGGVSLVVMDASMPGMSGRQAFAVIRAIDPAVPVLFASGHPVSDIAPEPTTGFLHKPYTPSALAAAVRKALDSTSAPRG